MITIIGAVRRVSRDDVQPRWAPHAVVKMGADSTAGSTGFKVTS